MKFLNGPMQGRDLTLPAGELTLGIGDVDLQAVFDNDISRIVLHVNEQSVTLDDRVACWVEGRVFTGGMLPTGKIIDLAGQGIVLLNEGDSFTSRRIPERLAAGRWRLSRTQIRIISAVLGTALLVTGGSVLYLWQRQETVDQLVDRLGVQRWLIQQHKTPALRTLGFEWRADGTVRIYGECLQQQALDSVLQILRNKGVFWRLETRCQDRLLDDVRDLLAEHGYLHVEVSNGSWPGEVRIRGNIRADDRWQQVVRQFAELPGLKRWSVSGSVAGRTQWLMVVREAGLMGRLSMERQNDHLIVSGLLNAAEQQRLKRGLKTLIEQERLTLIFQLIPPRGARGSDIFPRPLASIGGGKDNPWLELTDGRRLQVGAALNEGFEIAGIVPGRGVDVYRDGQLLHISSSF
ncbi:MAG TPA: type III secretion system inner membrane ring subunit SctD [Buttiauxella sp.]|jgi:type III secretion protein D